MYKIQYFFGVGDIRINKVDNYAIYAVNSVKDLSAVVIPHFYKFPLLTQKQADFLLFKSAIELILRKEHLTMGGLAKIINIRASMNLGSSDALITAFPNIKPVERPKVEAVTSIEPSWLVGFTEGEGCFFPGITKSKASKVGSAVSLRFILVQHIRDIHLMNSICNYFNCGKLVKYPQNVQYRIDKLSDIDKILIPLFNKHPLVGSKRHDYLDFVKIAELMKNKAHLTDSGLEKIRLIKAGMNKGRS